MPYAVGLWTSLIQQMFERNNAARRQHPWTVESLVEAASMSRSAFAVRFKELMGQTPLEYLTEWRMQKAMQMLQQRDRKLIDVARLVGYESDAAFSKAFKRVVDTKPGQCLKPSRVWVIATGLPLSKPSCTRHAVCAY